MNYTQFNDEYVTITTKKGSKYYGIMYSKPSDKERFLLKNLVILNKDGTTKAASGAEEKRFFKKENITNVVKTKI